MAAASRHRFHHVYAIFLNFYFDKLHPDRSYMRDSFRKIRSKGVPNLAGDLTVLRRREDGAQEILRQVLHGRSVTAIATDLGILPSEVLERFKEVLVFLVHTEETDASNKNTPSKPGDDMPA